mgnify:CR=1 FL=1
MAYALKLNFKTVRNNKGPPELIDRELEEGVISSRITIEKDSSIYQSPTTL